MLSENIANVISIYAAVVSTYLGGRAIWKERIRFDTACAIIGDPYQEDVIAVYNKSNKSVVIKCYCVVIEDKEIDLRDPAYFLTITIKPQEVYKIIIDGSYKFNWSGDIYLKLELMGVKKPVKIKLEY